jgi:alkaline phosphatase D
MMLSPPTNPRAKPALILGPIVGGLSDTQANLWGRADGPGTLHAWLGSQPDLSDAVLAASSLPLTPDTGFAGVAPLRGLAPQTHYHYALTFDRHPPAPSSQPHPSFYTFPPAGEPVSFNFAFGSCFRPEGPGGGAIFNALERRRQIDHLRFILMIGDQIYADAYDYNGIGKVACTLDEYRAVYAYTWSRPALRQLLANLPAFMTLDDHEVDDDWTWTSPLRLWAQIPLWDRVERYFKGRPLPERRIPLARVQAALQAYWEHQGMHAPAFELPPQLDAQGQYSLNTEDPGSLAYSFNYGAAAFCVLDTRSMRFKNLAGRSMLGEGQWKMLESWLLAVNNRYPVKFLVTSASVLFDMWIDLARDRWSGFKAERARLLHLLADNSIEGLYLLAGDLHSAHAVCARLRAPQGDEVLLWEFCSTPFEQSPNRLSKRTYTRPRTRALKSQQCLFNIAQHNFGLVRVEFSSLERPRVIFEVYGKDGELLGEAGDTETP